MREIVKREAIASSIVRLCSRGGVGRSVVSDSVMLHQPASSPHRACIHMGAQVSTALGLRIGLRGRYSLVMRLTYSRVGERGRRAVRAAQGSLAREPGVLLS